MEYDNKNRGALFKNDKEGNDARPDYKGSTDIEGVKYFVSAWISTAKSGQKYMSLKYEKDTGQRAAAAPKSQSIEDMDSDIPF
jgi:uncharacterized protein (DUF736 family)